MDHHEGVTQSAPSRNSFILWIAISLIVAFWIETFLVGILESGAGYSHVEHAISVLTIADPPLGTIHRISFIFLGAAAFGFAYVIKRTDQETTLAKGVLVALLVVHGVGRVAEGVFIWNPDALGSTASLLHQTLGMLGVLAMLPAPFVAARIAGKESKNSTARKSALVIGFVFLLLFALGVVLTVLPLGLGQRVAFLIWYAWLIYFAVTITRV